MKAKSKVPSSKDKNRQISKKPSSKNEIGLNLTSLRLSQDFAANLNIKKAIITVPVKKPHRQWFIRVHSNEEFRFQTGVIELKDERETYLAEQMKDAPLAAAMLQPVVQGFRGQVVPRWELDQAVAECRAWVIGAKVPPQ